MAARALNSSQYSEPCTSLSPLCQDQPSMPIQVKTWVYLKRQSSETLYGWFSQQYPWVLTRVADADPEPEVKKNTRFWNQAQATGCRKSLKYVRKYFLFSKLTFFSRQKYKKDHIAWCFFKSFLPNLCVSLHLHTDPAKNADQREPWLKPKTF